MNTLTSFISYFITVSILFLIIKFTRPLIVLLTGLATVLALLIFFIAIISDIKTHKYTTKRANIRCTKKVIRTQGKLNKASM
ncbi:hypothetical protein [Bathymodiolus platifrons methanotrophic gill symbiont]|uniref:hypothetical protein n=1 Tax=Bathymodiolus platifrons methanotrophic gill symbiont TaxID=113268 RepID=UPI001124D88F|nr:hypothetical protein [Bathymodiolus platifrons methanotrophic gill symbiont]